MMIKTCMFFVIPFLISCLSLNSCYVSKNYFGVEDNVHPDFLLGKYASISESEWHQILVLKENRNAELITLSWYPGEADNPTEDKIELSWIYEHPLVNLNNGKIIEKLKYLENISLSRFDMRGTAPGLEILDYRNENRLIYRTLWKEPRRTEIAKELYKRAMKD